MQFMFMVEQTRPCGPASLSENLKVRPIFSEKLKVSKPCGPALCTTKYFLRCICPAALRPCGPAPCGPAPYGSHAS